MSTTVLTDCKLYVDQFDISGAVNKLSLGYKVDSLDATTFGSGGVHVHKGGLKDIEIAHAGFWDANGTSAPDDLLPGRLGSSTDVVTSIVPLAEADGGRAFTTLMMETDYQLGSGVGELLGFSFNGTARGKPLVQGTILHPSATSETATGTGTARAITGPTAGQKLYAALHVLSIGGSGTPTITAKIQSAPLINFASPTDQITFTAATAVGAQWGSVAGAQTDGFWRVSFTISGTLPTFTFLVVVGVA